MITNFILPEELGATTTEPLSITAEQSREDVIAAQMDFTDTAEKHGRQVALAMFNRRVSRWANAFTNKRLRHYVFVLGSAMNGETHSAFVSMKDLAAGHQRWYGKPISKWTMIRYNKILEEAGIITITRTKQDERGDHPGMQWANVYHVDFSKVLSRESVTCNVTELLTHNFLDPGSTTQVATQDATQDATQVATPPSIDSFSSSPNYPSSLPREKGSPKVEDKTPPPAAQAAPKGAGDKSPGSLRDRLDNSSMGRVASSRSGNRGKRMENSYWVEPDGTFWKQSKRARGLRDKPITLTADQAVFLWGPALKALGSSPNPAQKMYMKMLTHGHVSWPSKFPLPPAREGSAIESMRGWTRS